MSSIQVKFNFDIGNKIYIYKGTLRKYFNSLNKHNLDYDSLPNTITGTVSSLVVDYKAGSKEASEYVTCNLDLVKGTVIVVSIPQREVFNESLRLEISGIISLIKGYHKSESSLSSKSVAKVIISEIKALTKYIIPRFRFTSGVKTSIVISPTLLPKDVTFTKEILERDSLELPVSYFSRTYKREISSSTLEVSNTIYESVIHLDNVDVTVAYIEGVTASNNLKYELCYSNTKLKSKRKEGV